MHLLIYIFIAVVTCFIMWKRRGQDLLDSLGPFDAWVEKVHFWDIAYTTVLWPIAVPVKLLWAIMDRIYNHFNTKPPRPE